MDVKETKIHPRCGPQMAASGWQPSQTNTVAATAITVAVLLWASPREPRLHEPALIADDDADDARGQPAATFTKSRPSPQSSATLPQAPVAAMGSDHTRERCLPSSGGRKSPIIEDAGWFKGKSTLTIQHACDMHFKQIACEVGIVHPAAALRSAAECNWPDAPTLFESERSRPPEGCVWWDGRHFHKVATLNPRARNPFLHVGVLDALASVVAVANPAPFNATVVTHDNGWHASNSNQIVVAANPYALRNSTALLPLHKWHMLGASLFGPQAKPFKWDPKLPQVCQWGGSHTGHPELQVALNANRTKCGPRETDRECVVRLVGKQSGGKVAFLERDGHASKPRHDMFNSTACLLAVDGHSFAGILFQGMLEGKVMLRVGGYTEGKRVSAYEWFEPLLVSGIHYLRADIDHLESAMAEVAAMPSSQLGRIARNGYAAAKALFTVPSSTCYSAIALGALTPRLLPNACEEHFRRTQARGD